MANKTERITIRVTAETKRQLKSEAKRDKRSLSQFCDVIFTFGLLNYASNLVKGKSKEQTA